MHVDPRPPSSRPPRAHFRRLLVGSALSNVGDGITFVALPLLLVSTGASAAHVGAFMATMQLPRLFAPFAGELADRYSRRWLMVISDVTRAIGICLIALLAREEHTLALIALYALAFLMGAGDVLHDAVAPALLPTLVAAEDLESANGTLEGTLSVAGALVGPPLGALLFTLHPELPLLVDGVSFLASALLMLQLPADVAPPRRAATRVLTSLAESFRWLRREPRLLTLIATSSAISLVFAGMHTMLVFYAYKGLGLSELTYGILLGLFGIGGLLAGVSLGRMVDRFGTRAVLVSSALVLGGGVLALALFSAVPVVGAALFVGGAAVVSWSAANAAVRQRLVPNEMLGRISSVAMLASASMMAVGSLLSGVLVERYGVRDTFLAAAALAMAAGLFLLLRSRGFSFPAGLAVVASSSAVGASEPAEGQSGA